MEGDEIITLCPTENSYNAEIHRMNAVYGKAPHLSCLRSMITIHLLVIIKNAQPLIFHNVTL